MTDGIKITDGGGLQSTVTLSASAVTFNGAGFQKVTFDGDTFDSMDDFWNYVRTLRAENARLAKALSAAEKLKELLSEVQRQGCEVCGGDCASAYPPTGYCPMKVRSEALEAYRNTTGETERVND